jgi:hypothetical protein
MSQYVVISLGGAWKGEGNQKLEGCDICHNERLSPYSDEHSAGIPGAFVLALPVMTENYEISRCFGRYLKRSCGLSLF